MIKLLLKLLAGALAIPAAIGVSQAFYKNLLLIHELSGTFSSFLWGIAVYAAMHILFFKPTFLYVLGHESVHAGMSWLMGGRIKSFKVSNEGGSVASDKTNTLTQLGPYFVPIYAILITIVYFLVASSYNVNPSVFVFLVGFALSFHIISTVEVMKVRQPDIVKSGYFFSVVMIYALNIIVIAMLFALLFPSFSAKKFWLDSWSSSKEMYVGITRQLFAL